jgi:hypothetical protein
MAYSKEKIESIFSDICNRIEGGESLKAILRSDNTPSSQTFYKWLDADKNKANQYARATELRTEAMLDEIIDISDNVGQDVITLPDGSEVVNHAVIARDKLRVDTRKWAMSKMNPKKYGDKVDIDHTTKGDKIEQKTINLSIDGKDIDLGT